MLRPTLRAAPCSTGLLHATFGPSTAPAQAATELFWCSSGERPVHLRFEGSAETALTKLFFSGFPENPTCRRSDVMHSSARRTVDGGEFARARLVLVGPGMDLEPGRRTGEHVRSHYNTKSCPPLGQR
jgi:hypothetical protein